MLGWFENGVFGINWKTPCSFGLCLFVMEDCYPYMELCEFRKRTHQNFSNWCCRHVYYFQNLSVFFCRKMTYLVLKIVILWFNKIFVGLYMGFLKNPATRQPKSWSPFPFLCLYVLLKASHHHIMLHGQESCHPFSIFYVFMNFYRPFSLFCLYCLWLIKLVFQSIERKGFAQKKSSWHGLKLCATGQIGYALVPMIARGAMLGPDQPVIIHMLDIEPAAEALNGVKMELIDAAFPLLKGTIDFKFVCRILAFIIS